MRCAIDHERGNFTDSDRVQGEDFASSDDHMLWPCTRAGLPLIVADYGSVP